MIRLFLEEPKGFYLYIGITSLYLKDTTARTGLQDGIVDKRTGNSLYKTQISAQGGHFPLTSGPGVW